MGAIREGIRTRAMVDMMKIEGVSIQTTTGPAIEAKGGMRTGMVATTTTARRHDRADDRDSGVGPVLSGL